MIYFGADQVRGLCSVSYIAEPILIVLPKIYKYTFIARSIPCDFEIFGREFTRDAEVS
jgi:hypothetical protein